MTSNDLIGDLINLKMMSNEVAAASFEVLSWNVVGRTEENPETHQSG
jgi:hypothetical protein